MSKIIAGAPGLILPRPENDWFMLKRPSYLCSRYKMEPGDILLRKKDLSKPDIRIESPVMMEVVLAAMEKYGGLEEFNQRGGYLKYRYSYIYRLLHTVTDRKSPLIC